MSSVTIKIKNTEMFLFDNQVEQVVEGLLTMGPTPSTYFTFDTFIVSVGTYNKCVRGKGKGAEKEEARLLQYV